MSTTAPTTAASNATDSPDRLLLDHLRREGAASVGNLTALLGVTATAVRQRLQRLMGEGLVERSVERHSRGRPSHNYRLTAKGQRLAGDNFGDLAKVLWEEIRQIEDPQVRDGLLKRLAVRLASEYTQGVGGGPLADKMRELQRMMKERESLFDVDDSGQLPILTALACPYPELAENDRSICDMERMMIAEVLGESVKLSQCKLDGGSCCSFEPEANQLESPPNVVEH